METDIDKLNTELKDVLVQRENLDSALVEAWEVSETLDAEYKVDYHKAISRGKVEQPDATQTDLKALAEIVTHDLRLKCIVAEAKYRKLKLDSERLHDKFEVLRELSYNERSKNKTLGSLR